jgi:hypothetical protein
MEEQQAVPQEKKTPEEKTDDQGLSRKGEPDRDPVFYYSRERRLARAPQSVRDLYDTSSASRPTLFKALTGGTRSGAMLLITIVVVSFVIVVLSRGLKESGGTKLGGNTLTVSALSFPEQANETTYIVLNKKTGSEKAYTGTVDVAVSIYKKAGEAGEDMPIATHRVFFTLEPEEDFRFSVPFTGPELILMLRAEDELATLQVKPD